MEPIFPLHEDHVSRFCGLPVCIVTKDGKRHVGVLSNCRGGRVMLNGDPSHHSGPNAYLDHHDSSELAKTKRKQHKKTKSIRARGAAASSNEGLRLRRLRIRRRLRLQSLGNSVCNRSLAHSVPVFAAVMTACSIGRLPAQRGPDRINDFVCAGRHQSPPSAGYFLYCIREEAI